MLSGTGLLRHNRKLVNETIWYCVAPCALGRLLVASTTEGVCSVAFADSDTDLLAELRARFTAATFVESQAALARHVCDVQNALQQPPSAFQMPLHVRGTVFQECVWRALRAIPFGETRTYAEVALAIGRPAAARAVARACATNPVAFAIPCHRVLGSDGDLRGYRWGVERKRALLALERPGGARGYTAGETAVQHPRGE